MGYKKKLDLLFVLGIGILILLGVSFRFAWSNWSQGASLHPDEYGLTNTLTQLRLPQSLSEYFNTRISPLSPYPRYDEWGNVESDGPDNAMRWGQWPIILIRFATELIGTTGYDELRLTGRFLSALADSISILFIFLIGRLLYDRYIGLLAALLSSFTVLQIQQSHFMTVDNFAVLFTMVSIFSCIQVARHPLLSRPSFQQDDQNQNKSLEINWFSFVWYLVFGIGFGMAMASKINLLPLGAMIAVAGFIGIADLRLRNKRDLRTIFSTWIICIAFALTIALFTFRFTQPMSFRQPIGDTTLLSFDLNPDWIRNLITAQQESNGIGGGPPGEQWAHRLAIIFPWINMVLWGMGLPMGIMSWIGFFWTGYRTLRFGDNWRWHLIPLIWTGGFFFFMATRWVKSMRYFLPIYPFLALFAALGIVTLWRRFIVIKTARKQAFKASPQFTNFRILIPLFITLSVVLGTLVWAMIFLQAIYLTDHTRIQATRWIYENIPASFQLGITDSSGNLHYEPVAASENLVITSEQQFTQRFKPRVDGELSKVIIPHIVSQYKSTQLWVAISADIEGKQLVDETIILVSTANQLKLDSTQGIFHKGYLNKGTEYYFLASVLDQNTVTVSRSVIANESWDEGLPFPFDGYDPFGQLYHGLTMEVRWYDDDNKREMFINALEESDYIILSSQRAIWSTCRLPRTYPMTMEYYRALFSGKLGFDLIAKFEAPFRLGPLQISDLAGKIGINQSPPLPIFNHELLAAEEAFSVYDHPPVWIFKKRPDFRQDSVKFFFDSIDLSQVVIQSPRDADLSPCP